MNAPAKPITRRATNVSLDQEAVAEAKALGINVSRACEAGLKAAIREEARARWLTENRAAIDEFNAWVETNDVPHADLHES
ncbi:type II toxin-antitoxin system CcdA family antitoxin [Sphingomonas sp. DT-204]|uniref:type II toxin-antitoxin system CcdA family antitoxin n=1 Tax=Sphingomonas sp. DT-204 TaxID=3396166 RepID=UPI003F1CBCBE